MKTIIEEIKKEIKNHQNVKNSVLKDIAPWKRTHYILLAEIVSQELSHSKFLEGERKFELGNTISYITLQRFFENAYKASALNDLRFLKTLHKLCIFLGYYDLNEFILGSNDTYCMQKDEDYSKIYCSIVENLCLEEFEIIKGLPHKNINSLYIYTFKDSKTSKNIKDYIDKYKEANYFFDKQYEEAKFEMVSCELIADEKDYKIIKSVENWDFVLRNTENKTIYYKVFNSQTYYLKKDKKGNWKIWNNYNPNNQKLKSNFL
jgi:hypothetical protein